MTSMAADVPANPEHMIAGYNTLGHAVFRVLARSDGNIVISPLSIGLALAMGFAGAAGETADEMARALGIAGPRPGFFKANADLLRHYRDSDAPEAVPLRLANALVLTRHAEAVAKPYRDLLAESFAAEIFAGDIARINQWVAQKTEGMIDRALDRLPPDDVGVLLNAIYFKAPWETPFNPASTYDAGFLRGWDPDDFSKIEVDVKMMHRNGDYVIVGGPQYRAARLPYKIPSLGMIVVLPDEESGVGAILDAFDMAELARLRAELACTAPVDATLNLPRFHVESRSSVKAALQQAGIVRAFDWTRADFRGITERPPAEIPVAIDDIAHCAVIDVAEEGTVAAAKTLVSFHIGGVPPVFHVDRPFLFFVVDETTGAVLFAGKVVDPR
jgi:serpin B